MPVTAGKPGQARQGWANWVTPLSETGHQIYLILSLVFEGQNVALNEEAELVRGAQWGEILFFSMKLSLKLSSRLSPKLSNSMDNLMDNLWDNFCRQFQRQF